MKRIVVISILLLSISFTISAQQRPGERLRKHRITNGFNSGQLNRTERLRLNTQDLRYRIAERKVQRDGIVTPLERRMLQKRKQQNRKTMFRLRHNNRLRVI